MNFSLALLALVGLRSASAGVSPKLSVTVKDGSFANLKDSFTPKFSIGGKVAGGLEMGAELDVGLDVLGTPKSMYCEKSTDLGSSGWTLKAHAEYSEHKYDYPEAANGRGVYLSVEANDADRSCFGWVSGDLCQAGPQPLKFGGKKVVNIADKGKVMVEPRYRFTPGTTPEGPDVCIGIEPSDCNTQAYLTANMKDQNLLVSHNVNADNTVSVKAGTAQGFLFARLENQSDMGKSTVTVTSDDLDLQLETQDGWKAGMSVGYPYHKSEPQVRFSKTFSVGATDL